MNPVDVLGAVWYEEEVSGWKGVWTRVGRTNEFTAEFTHPSGERIGGRLRMTVNGDEVTIYRYNPGMWGKCAYIGTFSPDFSTVSGTYFCTDKNDDPTPKYTWNARIVR